MLKNIFKKLAKNYIRWTNNFSYNFEKNDEKWILSVTKKLNFEVIFDVGANIGHWTKEANNAFANAEIHCFELSEDTYNTLRKNINFLNANLNNVGLSNKSGEIEYKDYGKNSKFNTVIMSAEFHDKQIQSKTKYGKVITGDEYCEANDIHFVDFLKIDVEGAEHFVLQGFSRLLSMRKVRIIQFEYGYINGDARYLMRDFYDLFSQWGYIVGRLTLGRVEFIEWTYELNDFDSGPNYIAIRESDKELIHALSAK